jgi:hypothetical protein
VEGKVSLPAEATGPETWIEVTPRGRGAGDARFGAFHYWAYGG